MGHVVILRGNSGSGKSTVGHRFVDSFPHEEIYEDGWNKLSPKLIGYALPGDLYVLGPYRARGGGLDLLSSDDRSRYAEVIERYAAKGHVFAESLVLTNMYGYVARLADALGRANLTAVTLDTDAETCIQNIYLRNGGKPIKEDAVRSNGKNVERGTRRLLEEQVNVVMTDRFNAFDRVVDVLQRAGWALP